MKNPVSITFTLSLNNDKTPYWGWTRMLGFNFGPFPLFILPLCCNAFFFHSPFLFLKAGTPFHILFLPYKFTPPTSKPRPFPFQTSAFFASLCKTAILRCRPPRTHLVPLQERQSCCSGCFPTFCGVSPNPDRVLLFCIYDDPYLLVTTFPFG